MQLLVCGAVLFEVKALIQGLNLLVFACLSVNELMYTQITGMLF